MRIALGADHVGCRIRKLILDHLRNINIVEKVEAIIDYGTMNQNSVDYPKYAKFVAKDVSEGKVDRGILICATGIGMSIAANRFPKVRAALCNDLYSVHMTRRHNDANILCLGVGYNSNLFEMVDAFLNTPFEGGRHERRVKQIDTICKD